MDLNKLLMNFPTSQRQSLAAVFGKMRRLVDQNLDAVAAVYNATTTIASLTCPASALQVGSCMHMRVAGTLTNTSTATTTVIPLLALNGTTILTDTTLTIADTGTAVQAFVMDARIYWQYIDVVHLEGVFYLSADAALPDTGTAGSLAATSLLATPFYHTLTGQQMARDQILTMTLAVPNTSTVNASKKVASLWVE